MDWKVLWFQKKKWKNRLLALIPINPCNPCNVPVGCLLNPLPIESFSSGNIIVKHLHFPNFPLLLSSNYSGWQNSTLKDTFWHDTRQQRQLRTHNGIINKRRCFDEDPDSAPTDPGSDRQLERRFNEQPEQRGQRFCRRLLLLEPDQCPAMLGQPCG